MSSFPKKFRHHDTSAYSASRRPVPALTAGSAHKGSAFWSSFLPVLLLVVSAVSLIFFPYLRTVSGDGGNGHYAIWASNAAILHSGELPLWNNCIWGGFANVGHIFSVFYPVMLVLQLIFWDPQAQLLSFMIFPVYLAVHLSLLGCGIFFLCRYLKHRPIVAFVIAELAMLSGSTLSISSWLYIFGGVAWMPWLLLSLFAVVREDRRRRLWIALSALSLGMLGLASTAHGLIFACLLYALVFFCALWAARGDKTKCIVIVKSVFLSGFLGLCLCAVELLPFAETTLLAYRFIPGLEFSEAAQAIPLSLFTEHAVQPAQMNTLLGSYSFNSGFWALNTIFSALVLIGFFMKNEKEQWIFNTAKIIFLFSLFYSVAFGLTDLFWYLPGFNSVREPFLYAPFLVFGASLLAANALSLLLRAYTDRVVWLSEKHVFFPHTLAFLLLLLFAITLLPHRVQDKTDLLAKLLFILFWALPVFLSFCSRHAVLSGIERRLKQTVSAVFLRRLCTAVLFVLAVCNYCSFMNANRNFAFSAQSAVDQVSKVNVSVRDFLTAIDEETSVRDDSARILNWGSPTLPSNVAAAVGANDCLAYLNPIYKKTAFFHNYADLYKRVQLQNIKYILLPAETEEGFDEWITAVFGHAPQEAPLLTYTDYNDTALSSLRYVDTSALRLGSAWMVYSAGTYAASDSGQEVIGRLNDGNFDVSASVLINEDTIKDDSAAQALRSMQAATSTRIENLYTGNNTVSYTVSSDTGGVLVTSDYYYPGWSVYVDGSKQSILEVNYTFRGVYLPAGAHEVTFRYEPFPLRLGFLLLTAAAVIIAVLIITDRKKARL